MRGGRELGGGEDGEAERPSVEFEEIAWTHPDLERARKEGGARRAEPPEELYVTDVCHMYLCIYISMYVCMYVCMNVRT